MNIYRFQFDVSCPNNDERINYKVEIRKAQTIMVENIASWFSSLSSEYHEAIADSAWERFGGYQIITAHHHGVDIETHRGEP